MRWSSQGPCRRTTRGAAATVGAAVLAAVLLVGCSAGPRGEDAVAAAREFFDAVADDFDGACALLAPATVDALERETGASCPEAVGDGETGLVLQAVAVTAQDAAASATVAGRQAQVVLGDEVTFLTLSGDSWRVTATACTPRPERPYDCELEGD